MNLRAARSSSALGPVAVTTNCANAWAIMQRCANWPTSGNESFGACGKNGGLMTKAATSKVFSAMASKPTPSWCPLLIVNKYETPIDGLPQMSPPEYVFNGERSRPGCRSARPRAEHCRTGCERRGRRSLRPRRARSPLNKHPPEEEREQKAEGRRQNAGCPSTTPSSTCLTAAREPPNAGLDCGSNIHPVCLC